MNTTGRAPGFGMFHIGMRMRLVQSVEPPEGVVDATGECVGIDFILWNRKAIDAVLFLVMALQGRSPLWWCCATSRCVSTSSSMIATPSSCRQSLATSMKCAEPTGHVLRAHSTRESSPSSLALTRSHGRWRSLCRTRTDAEKSKSLEEDCPLCASRPAPCMSCRALRQTLASYSTGYFRDVSRDPCVGWPSTLP